MKRLKFWLPVALWAGVIFSLSSLRVTPSSNVYWQDFLVKKTAHIVEYAILFIFSYRAFLNTTELGRARSAIFALLFVIFYGVSDEYHQSFTPGREPKIRDVLIDSIGGSLAWIGLWKYLPKMPAELKSLAKSLQIV